MTAATLDVEAAPLVATPNVRIFWARRKELRLVQKAIRTQFEEGRKVGETEGVTLEFRDHKLIVPIDGVVQNAQQRDVETGPLLEWIEKHRLFGDRFDGFWEEKQVAPAPTAEELTQLLSFATGLQEESIVAFIEAERAGWARPGLLAPAEEALANVRAVLADAEAKAIEAARVAAENA